MKYKIIYADPPWSYQNGGVPQGGVNAQYNTMTLAEIKALPVNEIADSPSVLLLWATFPQIQEALEVIRAWGFEYKTNIIWHKVRKDGGPDGRGVGFYFRNTTEMILMGIRGKLRTLAPGRRQVNIIRSQKQEHSRKPDELYKIIEACSPGPYLELFARGKRQFWDQWGNEVGH